MNYSMFSTSALEKILDRSAEGSAEQRAVQDELRLRHEGVPSPETDEQTMKLFTAEELAKARRH